MFICFCISLTHGGEVYNRCSANSAVSKLGRAHDGHSLPGSSCLFSRAPERPRHSSLRQGGRGHSVITNRTQWAWLRALIDVKSSRQGGANGRASCAAANFSLLLLRCRGVAACRCMLGGGWSACLISPPAREHWSLFYSVKSCVPLTRYGRKRRNLRVRETLLTARKEAATGTAGTEAAFITPTPPRQTRRRRPPPSRSRRRRRAPPRPPRRRR